MKKTDFAFRPELADKYQLEALTYIAHGIARHFGNDCEVCIHDLETEDPERSIVYIVNGHVSGRKVGDGPSKIILESIEALKQGLPLSDQLCYLTKGTGGKILKSSTIFAKDYRGNFHYVISINHDISGFASVEKALHELISINEENCGNSSSVPDAIPNSVGELLDSLIEQSVALIGKAPALMSKEEKVRAITFLNDAGAFLIQKSGDKVADYFGISKFTLYSYVDVKKKKEEF